MHNWKDAMMQYHQSIVLFWSADVYAPNSYTEYFVSMLNADMIQKVTES